jgi:hypothetical protein
MPKKSQAFAPHSGCAARKSRDAAHPGFFQRSNGVAL